MPVGTFLNGRTPDQPRGLMWLALSDIGVRQRLTATGDSGGGASQVWVNVGTTECRIDPLKQRQFGSLTAGQVDERSSHAITVPPGFTINAADRFAISGKGTFEVTTIYQRTAADALTFEVLQIS